MTDPYGQQTAFAPVQQLQDSSTLESQALSASFHQQSLLPVPGSDAMNVVSVRGVPGAGAFRLPCNLVDIAHLGGHADVSYRQCRVACDAETFSMSVFSLKTFKLG